MEILTTRTDCLYRVHNESCQKLCETRMLPRPRDSRNISLVTLLYAYLCGLQRVRPMKMDPKRSCSCRQSYKTGSVRGGRVKCGRGVAVNHISGAPCWANELRGQWPEREGGPALISSGGEEDKHLDRFPQIGAPLPNVPVPNTRKDDLWSCVNPAYSERTKVHETQVVTSMTRAGCRLSFCRMQTQATRKSAAGINGLKSIGTCSKSHMAERDFS